MRRSILSLVLLVACAPPASFELRVEPSLVTLSYDQPTVLALNLARSNIAAEVSVLVELLEPPRGFSAPPVVLTGTSGTFILEADRTARPGRYELALRAFSTDPAYEQVVPFEVTLQD